MPLQQLALLLGDLICVDMSKATVLCLLTAVQLQSLYFSEFVRLTLYISNLERTITVTQGLCIY